MCVCVCAYYYIINVCKFRGEKKSFRTGNDLKKKKRKMKQNKTMTVVLVSKFLVMCKRTTNVTIYRRASCSVDCYIISSGHKFVPFSTCVRARSHGVMRHVVSRVLSVSLFVLSLTEGKKKAE